MTSTPGEGWNPAQLERPKSPESVTRLTLPTGRIPHAGGLDPRMASNWIEVDRAALAANLEGLRGFLAEGTEVIAVVKGNAYGHGIDPVIPVLEQEGVRAFAVFSAAEAVALREVAAPDSRLLIMGHVPPSGVPWVVATGMEPWIGAKEMFPLYAEEVERQDKPLRVHLEVETGMNRLGVPVHEAQRIARAIADHPLIELEGVCTHLAGAEDHRNDARIESQRRIFEAFLEELAESGIAPRTRHVSSSSAALLHKDLQFEAVRLGVALYGFWPTREVYHRHRKRFGEHTGVVLERALEWKSRIMKVESVLDGDYIGYGLSCQAEGNQLVATVPVGYSDGFSRSLSNQGHVLIRGRRATLLGAVNMNMIQVRVTHVPDVHIGDEVVIIGRQGDQEITVTSFADYNNVVNYELMSRLPIDIPRLLVDHGGSRMPAAAVASD